MLRVNGRFLALDHPIVRMRLDEVRSRRPDRHKTVQEPLKVFLVDATGGGLGLLGARLHTRNLEVHAILHALAPYPATETSLSSGGWNEVTAAANARVDILHFIGHANYDRARNEAGVVPIVGRQWTKVSAESARLNWRLSCWRPSGVQDSADAR
jgi:hypothetical protein